MSNIKNFDSFNEEKKWIQDAIKEPGSLRRSLGKKKGEKISNSEISSEISALRKKDRDESKPGLQLGKRDKKKYKKLTLARTLKSMHEDVDFEEEFGDVPSENGSELNYNQNDDTRISNFNSFDDGEIPEDDDNNYIDNSDDEDDFSENEDDFSVNKPNFDEFDEEDFSSDEDDEDDMDLDDEFDEEEFDAGAEDMDLDDEDDDLNIPAGPSAELGGGVDDREFERKICKFKNFK